MLIVAERSRRLVSTGEAAKALGIDGSTLWRWVKAGIVKPANRTMGGHYRWDLEDLRHQMREHFHETRAQQREAAERGESGPPFAPELEADRPPHEDL